MALARGYDDVSNVIDLPLTATCRLQYPCAPSQARFWFEDALHPGNPGLNVAVRWKLVGRLSDEDLETAWRTIVSRQAALRTHFTTQDGEPMQIVEPFVPFALGVLDLTDRNETDARSEAERIAEREARTPFDLTVAPLVRVTRVVVRADETMLLVTAHHTVCDGWSIGILAREMGEICAAISEGRRAHLPALPLSYGEYSLEQRDLLASATFEREIEFIRERLADCKPFALATDRARPPIQTSNGAIVSTLLPRDLTDRLAALGRERGCTLFATALCALFVLLTRHSGEEDITLGTQVVGRDDEDLENVVGSFINTIALRADLSGSPSFVDLLERIRDVVMDSLEARHVPVERLIAIVNPRRDLSRNALFSVNFIFQRSFIENAHYGTFDLVDLPSRSAGAIYDLNFFMVERPDGWRASCEYNTDLFDAATVEGMLRRFSLLLAAIVAEPNRSVTTLPILDAADRRALALPNETVAAYPSEKTLSEIIGERARRTPDAIAIVSDSTTLSYGELEAASNRLARTLASRGFAPGTRIGVLLKRSAELPIALLAVLKAGAAYVPLDPAFPAERIDYIAQNSGLSAIVTRSDLRDRAGSIGVPLVVVDTPEIEQFDSGSYPSSPCPDDVAYVIYTSGSTGRPKGVAVTHRSLVNLLCATSARPGLGPDDTLVAVTTISFDIAALELFLPLLVGARLAIASNDDVTDGHRLRGLLDRYDATVMQATPVTWQLLLEAGWRGRPAFKMLCGGEALSRELANRLLSCGELWNMYGPTETTIWSSVLRVEAGDGPVPIGQPLANTQFYVVDTNGEVVPPGVPGELYIGGDGVALGYFEREDLTRERFVSDRFGASANGRLYRTGDLVRSREGGKLEFLGRSDNQIKLRGFRIELGEIEAALQSAPDVAEAVAIVTADAFGEKALVAYAVPRHPLRGADAQWTAALRARLAESLPSYMLPSPIVALDALPRTPNGKIDRAALPLPGTSVVTESAEDAPRSAIEETLAGLVGGLLGRDRIPRSTDIFSLGFHSLLAVRLVARIAESLGVALPLRTLFDHPTVEMLAARIDIEPENRKPRARESAVTRYHPEGVLPPFIFLHSDLFAEGLYCRKIAATLGASQPFVTVAPHGTAGLPLLPTIEAMAADYYDRVREIQPHGPYRIGGFCVSGLVAFELARLLRSAGERVDDVLLINSSSLPQRSIAPFDWAVRRIGLDSGVSPRFRELAVYNLARLHGAALRGPRYFIAFVSDRIGAFVARRRSGGAHHGRGVAEPQPFEKRAGERETENSFVHLVAALTYHPRSYEGLVTLIWSSEQELPTDDPSIGWNSVASRIRIASISGGHVAPLFDRIDELGALLKTLLAGERG